MHGGSIQPSDPPVKTSLSGGEETRSLLKLRRLWGCKLWLWVEQFTGAVCPGWPWAPGGTHASGWRLRCGEKKSLALWSGRMEAARGCLSLDVEWDAEPSVCSAPSLSLAGLGFAPGRPRAPPASPCWVALSRERQEAQAPPRPRPQPSFFQCHSCIFWSFVWFPNLSRRRPLN